MSRTRASAKKAGSSFERAIADHLRAGLGIREIDRMPKAGVLDKGDIANVRDSHDRLLAVECKNTSKLTLPAWVGEAQAEAINYDAHVGVVVHKRHGVADPGRQWVTMTVDDLIQLLTAPPTSGASIIQEEP